MFSILDEKSLVEQCRKQNRNAQQVLFERYSPKMMTISLRYMKNEADALEVLNTSFLQVFSKLGQYKSEGSLEGWIKRIVINSSIDFIRNSKIYRNTFIHTNEFALDGSRAEDDDSENAFNLDLSAKQIFELVQELPPATRVVFNLYVIDEFTHQQIAESLKISAGTSKWHLSNARTLLKEKIKQLILIEKKNPKS